MIGTRRIGRIARRTGTLLACLALVACDPLFLQVHRFEPPTPRELTEVELEGMERIGTDLGFSTVPDEVRASAQPEDAARSISAWYGASLRDDWGSCGVKLLTVAPSGIVELEASTFPAAREPAHLTTLRQALTATLLAYGYRPLEE